MSSLLFFAAKKEEGEKGRIKYPPVASRVSAVMNKSIVYYRSLFRHLYVYNIFLKILHEMLIGFLYCIVLCVTVTYKTYLWIMQWC